jgi:hypothetical protein
MKKKTKKSKPNRTLDGLKVVDADHNLIIDITKGDVSHSNKKDPANCAAAQAIKRQFKCKKVKVFMSRTYVQEGNKYVRYVTPQAVNREITSFDRGSGFEPGEYKINKPPTSQKLGHYRGKKTKTTGAKRSKYHFTANVRNWQVSK